MTSVLSPAFDSLLQETSTKFDKGEAADVIRELKEHYPDRCELFDQDDLYGALKQLHQLGAIDDDGDTKLLEVLAEKTSKKDQVLELINGYRESVPPCKNGFVGRDVDVNKIMKLVTNSHVPGVNLFGESGVGKTTLAKEVCKQLKDFEILSIDLRDIKDVSTIYFLVLQKFHLPAWDYSKERIYKHLKDLTRKTVLILDNIEQLLSKDDTADQEMRAKFLEFLLAIISTEASKRGHLKVILTSRIRIDESSLKRAYLTEYKVKPFNEKDSKTLLCKREIEKIDFSIEGKSLTEIAVLCRDIPYLLQAAEQLMRENYRTPTQVLDKITTQIEKRVPKEFACNSALFDAIPSDQLKQVAVKISLLRRPFSVSTAMKIAEIESEYDARFGLEMLVKHKIITAEDVDGKRKYDTHALFREFVTSYLCKEDPSYKEHFKRGESQFFEHFSGKLTKLAFLLETEFVETFSKLEVNKANFELTIEISHEQKETFDQLLHCDEFRIFAKMGILFDVLKDPNERRELFGKWAEAAENQEKWLTSALMRCWQSIQGSDLKGTLNEEILGKASASIQKANEAIKKPTSTTSSENVKEEEKQLKVESLFLHCRGKIKWMRAKIMTLEQRKKKDGKKLLEEGINDLQKAVTIGEKLIRDNTLTARAYNLIGNCYMELDSYQEAEKYYQKALDMKIALAKSEKHWEIPTYYNQMAQVHEMLAREEEEKWYNRFIALNYSAIKEHKEAVVWMKKALTLQEDLGVSDTAHTAIFQRNLANILIGLEQYDEALVYAETSYEIRKSLFGQHPETVRILYLIGIIHEWRKDHNAALQSYEKAFEMEESLPADNHSVVRKLLCDRLVEMCEKTKRKDKLKENEYHQSKSPSLSVDPQREAEDQSGDETLKILIIICVKKGKSCNSTTKRAFPLLTTHVSSDRREPVSVSYSVFKKHAYNNRIMNLTVLSNGCNEEPIQEEELKGYTRIMRSEKVFSPEKNNEAYLSISGGFGQQISELKWNFEEQLNSTTELEVDKDGSQCEMNEKLCISFKSEGRLIFEETLKMSDIFPSSTAYQPEGERVDDNASGNYVTIDSAQEAVGENACVINSSTRNVPEERRDLCSTQDDRVVNVTQVTQYNVNIVAKGSQVVVGENACVTNSTRNVSEERRAACLTQESKEEKEEEEQKDR